THDETAPRSILDHLCRDQGVCEERPEECSDEACVQSRENDKRGAALLQERAGGDSVEWQRDCINSKECPDLDAAHCGLATVGQPDEEEGEDEEEAAGEDVGDVAEVRGDNRRDEAGGVDADAEKKTSSDCVMTSQTFEWQ
ncbi:hypothetical protein H0H87_000273, partial [Tephrocybe sp. NHM501043]